MKVFYNPTEGYNSGAFGFTEKPIAIFSKSRKHR